MKKSEATAPKQLFDRLRDSITTKPETPPKDFRTVSQWAKEAGYSHPQALRILSTGVKAGNVEKKRFRVQCGSRVLFADHYRIKG